MTDVTIINGDCIAAMQSQSAGSIKTVVTSPPYNIGKNYDQYNDTNPMYLQWMGNVFEEIKRIISDDGNFFLNIGWTSKNFTLPYQLLNVALEHFTIQNNFIWVKHIKVGGATHGQYRASTSRFHVSNTWEHVFHLVKTKSEIDSACIAGEYDPSPWNGEEEKRKLHAYRARRRIAKNLGYSSVSEAAGDLTFQLQVAEYLEENPYIHKPQKDEGAVWFIPYEPVSREFNTTDHPAIYPVQLATNCILMTTKEGDTVFDPFSGSFTTGVACVESNRNYVGSELSADYCELGRQRLERTATESGKEVNIQQIKFS